MARYAIIENNKVINIIEAEADFAEAYDGEIVLTDESVGMGYDYINDEFSYTPATKTNEEIEEEAILWRNQELQFTDYISQTPDYPNRDAWLTYRQELRDWPSTADFPETKPTKPE
jgi:hypothetical protein